MPKGNNLVLLWNCLSLQSSLAHIALSSLQKYTERKSRYNLKTFLSTLIKWGTTNLIQSISNRRFDISGVVLENGNKYTFEVNATDNVGNKALPSSKTWYTGKLSSRFSSYIPLPFSC